MAEPATTPPRKRPGEQRRTPGQRGARQPLDVDVLQRWVEGADGRMSLLELPLAPELFLDPQVGDKMVQGQPHVLTVHFLFEMLHRHFADDKDVTLLSDVKHLIGPNLGPAPDISVVRGLPDLDAVQESYDLRRSGIPPCFILEVVSPSSARIRRTDEVDKVGIYERLGVQEYLLADLPRRRHGNRYRLKGYRLGPDRRYRPIEPDAKGRLTAESLGLAFAVSPEGDGLQIFDLASGRRLLTPRELVEDRNREAEARKREAEARRAAEERSRREAEARKREAEARREAEAEVARLRAELERSRQSGG